MITNIRTVALYVSDQDKSLDFYVRQLGFEVRADTDMGGLGRWLEIGTPGSQTTFVLADAAKFGKQQRVGDSADVTLATSDVHALHDRLAAADVDVSDVETESWGSYIKVTDPDGLQFVVSERP